MADVARVGRGATRRIQEALPLLPFLTVVVVFLIVPTVTVIVSSVYADGVFTLDRIAALFTGTALSALANSVLLSGATALLGALLGAVMAWLIVSSPPTSMVRRAVLSLCSVLAQFGGVALAFAFLATVGLNGVLTPQVIAFALLIGIVALPGAFLAKAFVERMPVHVHTAVLDAVVLVGGVMMISGAFK